MYRPFKKLRLRMVEMDYNQKDLARAAGHCAKHVQPADQGKAALQQRPDRSNCPRAEHPNKRDRRLLL